MRPKRNIATLTWGSLFLVASLLTLASVTTAPQEAIAQPSARHEALCVTGYGVVAHRGVPTLAPENTLASIRRALDSGSDFLEIDLRLTADGFPVLIHDRTVDRTTDGSGAVETMTLAEIRGLDAGSWFHEEFTGERVPTFDEFIDLVTQTPQRIFIELKDVWTQEQVALVTDTLDAHGMSERTVILSFSEATLRAVHTAHPEIARVWLIRKFDDTTVRLVAELGVQGVGARILMYERYPAITRQLDSIGVASMSYTLNDARSWTKARILGVNIIATDRAGALQDWLDG